MKLANALLMALLVMSAALSVYAAAEKELNKSVDTATAIAAIAAAVNNETDKRVPDLRSNSDQLVDAESNSPAGYDDHGWWRIRSDLLCTLLILCCMCMSCMLCVAVGCCLCFGPMTAVGCRNSHSKQATVMTVVHTSVPASAPDKKKGATATALAAAPSV